jgi:hypothetical protein
MRFEGFVQDHVPGLHSMSSRIPRLLIAARKDKGCIGAFMNVTAEDRRADCLPYSHESWLFG